MKSWIILTWLRFCVGTEYRPLFPAIDYPCFAVDDDRGGLLSVVQVLFWVIQGQALVSMIVAVTMK